MKNKNLWKRIVGMVVFSKNKAENNDAIKNYFQFIQSKDDSKYIEFNKALEEKKLKNI